jgi:hypothetical protein
LRRATSPSQSRLGLGVRGRPLADTVAVLETIDEVRRQLPSAEPDREEEI